MRTERYKLIVVAVIAGWVGAVVSNRASWNGAKAFAKQDPGPVRLIQARRFELVGKDGKVRAFLDVGETDRMLLTCMTKGDYAVGSLSLAVSGQDEPSIQVYDGRWAVFGIDHTKSGEMRLSFFDRKGMLRAALGLDKDGEPGGKGFTSGDGVGNRMAGVGAGAEIAAGRGL